MLLVLESLQQMLLFVAITTTFLSNGKSLTSPSNNCRKMYNTMCNESELMINATTVQKKIIQDILNENFSAKNFDAAISMIRNFSRRSNQVFLPLETRLELVEMLHPALREQQQEVIRARWRDFTGEITTAKNKMKPNKLKDRVVSWGWL